MTSIKEALESAGYEQCDFRSNWSLDIFENGIGRIFFKKKPEPKFPKVFKNENYKIEVDKNFINFERFDDDYPCYFFANESLPLLIEAVKYWEANKDD